MFVPFCSILFVLDMSVWSGCSLDIFFFTFAAYVTMEVERVVIMVILLEVYSEYLCSSEFNNECLMHKHSHTDRSRTGSSLQEGAGIIHDDTSRSECVCFDSNGPWNGCFSQTEIDFIVDVKFFGLPGHFHALSWHLNTSAASPSDGCSGLNQNNNRPLALSRQAGGAVIEVTRGNETVNNPM